MNSNEKKYQQKINDLIELIEAKDQLIKVLNLVLECSSERVEMYKEFLLPDYKPKITPTHLKIIR